MVGPACLDHRGPQAGGVRAGQDGMDGLSLPKGPYPTDGGGEPASPSRAQSYRGAVMCMRRSGRQGLCPEAAGVLQAAGTQRDPRGLALIDRQTSTLAFPSFELTLIHANTGLYRYWK